MDWIQIKNYENYEVNAIGDVRNIITGRIMKQSLDIDGYLRISLYNNGKVKTFRVHRLIGIHFIPNPDNKQCIDHINRNRTDNTLVNLRWATQMENTQNQSLHKDNKLKEQHICPDHNSYRFHICRNYITHTKTFKTLDEAKNYRDEYMQNL